MRKRWLVVGLVVVVGGGAGTAVYLSRDRGTARKAAVSTAVVDSGPVTVSVAATGTIAASSTRSLSFTVDGEVSAVNVQAGAKVATGALLASVDAVDATSAVADAQDSLDTAEGQLKTAEETAAAAAEAKVAAAAEAKAATASRAAAEAKSPAAETASAKAVPVKATASAAAVRSNSNESRNGSNSDTDAIFTAQEKVNQAEITLQEAKAALAGTTIKAPVAGTIMSLAGKVGTHVTKDETFVTLADTNAMKVEADFPEADAGTLAVGQTATVTLADRVGEAFAAQVIQVDPVGADDGTLVTYGVVLAFSDPPADLLVGQSAAVQVTTGKVATALRVPSTAVHDVSGGSGSVLVRAGNASTEQAVEVGLMGDQYTQIKSGLTAGDVVVRSW